MKRDRRNKTIILLLLTLSVFGLAIGFSAFTSTLTIESGLSVNPTSGTFSVRFSSSGTALRTDSIVATTSSPLIVMQDATISSESPTTITHLTGTFTEPGQTATYTFYATNNGGYDAYLSTITYLNVVGDSSNKVCTPGSGTSADSVESACNSISVKVTVGSENQVTGTTSLTNHLLSIGSFETITVVLEYAAGGSEANGPFTVSFGNIQLLYEQVEPVTPPTPSSEYVCSPVTSSTLGTVPAGSYTAGDEYTCQVSDTESYNFFVISSTADTVSLIMAQPGLPTATKWYVDSGGGASLNTIGPVTAFNYLSTATSSWTNLSNINMDYISDGQNTGKYDLDLTDLALIFSGMGCTVNLTPRYNGVSTSGLVTTIYNSDNTASATYTNLKARIPTLDEIFDLGCSLMDNSCPDYLDSTVGYWLLAPALTTVTDAGCPFQIEEPNAALYITTTGGIMGTWIAYDYILRPVIEVLKTDIGS